MNTSDYPSHLVAWRIFRYLVVRLALGIVRLGWWMAVKICLLVVGVLRLIASPASSGRAQDEFKDLLQSDSPGGQVPAGDGSDRFWRMYFQAYSPRLWRMRRLLPMSAGKDLKEGDHDRDR
jgi:hypothetical protein